MAILARILSPVFGAAIPMPAQLAARYPELTAIRLRRGGLAPRIGGWCLGRRVVAGITFHRWVWLADDERATAELLLHELGHVRQFEALFAFPLRYFWESLRRGYHRNRFEVEARHFAATRLRGISDSPSLEEDT